MIKQRLSRLSFLVASLTPKKWTLLTSEELDEFKSRVFELIQNAYRPIGGHINFKSPADVNFSDSNVWKAIDLTGDGGPDAVLFGKKSHGIKWVGMGQSNGRSLSEAIDEMKRDVSSRGNWAEVSGRMADLFLKKSKTPYISSQEEVEIILGRKVEWIGEVPEYPGVTGWYSRSIGGGDSHMKIIVGIPS